MKAADVKDAFTKQVTSLLDKSRQGREKPGTAYIGPGRQA